MNRNYLWEGQKLDLAQKETIMNIFTELKETIHKELRRSMMTITHQIETVNKTIKIILKEQNGNSGIKSWIFEMENSLEGINNWLSL